MKYRKLGRTGFEVSDIAHGLWGMSGWSRLGRSAISRRHAARRRSRLQLFRYRLGLRRRSRATVCWARSCLAIPESVSTLLRRFLPPTIAGRHCRNISTTTSFLPQHVFKYADLIRKQLRVDTIDVLQFHVWDDGWTNEPEFRSTVEKLKHDKIIRFFGLSINRWEPENGIKALRTGLVDAVQVIYNIFDQAPEDELFPLCQELNIGVIARVPLDEGSLGGKLTLETTLP
jgi:aryl-alcohol dehydrogenase-like predicted oxidoreductase